MDTEKRAAALGFLKSNSLGVLATASSEGQPHASAVLYIADDNFNIHFLTLANSRKYLALKANPRVAFTVETHDVPQTIQIEGVAEEIMSDTEKHEQSVKLIDLLMQNSHRYFAPLIKMDHAATVLIWIQPKWIRWADYSPLDKTGNVNVWTEIPVA